MCIRDRVNVVDVKKDCDFYFPAIIKQGEVVVSVSTGGSSPMPVSYTHLLPDDICKGKGSDGRTGDWSGACSYHERW